MPKDAFTNPLMAEFYTVDGRTARTRNVQWGAPAPRSHVLRPDAIARDAALKKAAQKAAVRRSDAAKKKPTPSAPPAPKVNPMLLPGWLTQQCAELRYRGAATWEIDGFGEHELTLLISLITRTPWVHHTTLGRAQATARDATRRLRTLLATHKAARKADSKQGVSVR